MTATRTVPDLRAQNRRLLTQDLELRRPVPRSLPSRIRLETTSRCNYGCLHCFKRREPDDEPQHTMPMKLWDQVAREVFPHTDVVELGFGGEPLQDPLLAERLATFDPDGPKLDLLTAGLELESWIDRLVPFLGRLTISVEALDQELYPMVRKGADLGVLLRGIEAFRRAIEGLPEPERPRLGFRVTLFGGNHALLASIIARLGQLGAGEVRLVHGLGLEENHKDLQITKRRMDIGVALQRAVLQGELMGVAVHYPPVAPVPVWPEDAARFRADAALPADAPWTRAAVAADGEVTLCCGTRHLAGVPHVALTSKGFRAAWTDPAFQVVRAAEEPVVACGFCPNAEGIHG
ncbi:MAG: hypothetical protein CMJ83_04600 [Planctomycetes bacterium]|nr:hypothetical protein [Planctomycetota bacterium]